MSNRMIIAIGVAAMTALSAAPAAAQQTVRELVMTPGKGVSFYVGTKHGITTFLSDNGACNLTVAIGDNPDMEGMNPSASTRFTAAVMPARPAKLETTDGHTLIFTCGPAAQAMHLLMPPEAKVKNGG